MNETQEAPARRILVAIDTSSHGAAALEAAAWLATELRAELQGLFIEDINLLRLAGLPFTREIDSSSGESRPLDTEGMEQALRLRAEGVRMAIAETAQQTSLRWSFRVSRGNLAQTMLAESLEADLLLIGSGPASPSPAAANVPRGPIMIIFEGSPSSHVVEMAQRLARMQGDTIVALVAPDNANIADATPWVSYVQRCSQNIESLLKAVRRWRPQLLLIDRSSELVSTTSINALVTRLPCPLVLVQ